MLVDLPGVSGVDAARERELLKEALHSRHVFTLVGVDLGVCPLKVGLRQDSRSSMSGAGDEDRVQVVLVDHPVEVGVGEALAGVRSSVAQQPRLRVL